MGAFVAFLSALLLVGVAALIHAVRSAPQGYEDASGFHLANAPRPAYRQRERNRAGGVLRRN